MICRLKEKKKNMKNADGTTDRLHATYVVSEDDDEPTACY